MYLNVEKVIINIFPHSSMVELPAFNRKIGVRFPVGEQKNLMMKFVYLLTLMVLANTAPGQILKMHNDCKDGKSNALFTISIPGDPTNHLTYILIKSKHSAQQMDIIPGVWYKVGWEVLDNCGNVVPESKLKTLPYPHRSVFKGTPDSPTRYIKDGYLYFLGNASIDRYLFNVLCINETRA